jgi:hypothetical protein
MIINQNNIIQYQKHNTSDQNRFPKQGVTLHNWAEAQIFDGSAGRPPGRLAGRPIRELAPLLDAGDSQILREPYVYRGFWEILL